MQPDAGAASSELLQENAVDFAPEDPYEVSATRSDSVVFRFNEMMQAERQIVSRNLASAQKVRLSP